MKLVVKSSGQEVEVVLSEGATPEDLLSSYSKANGEPVPTGSSLYSTSSGDQRNLLQYRNVQLKELGVKDGGTVHLQTTGNVRVKHLHTSSSSSSGVWKVVIIAVVGVLAVSLLIALPVEQVKSKDRRSEYGTTQYAILIDAGSSGSRLRIFTWNREALINGTGIITQIDSCHNSSAKGISEYAIAQDSAQSLTECLNHATDIIPHDHHHSTPLYLGATAGMRLLQETNASHAEAILTAIDRLFHTYPFDFENDNARIISGSEEGIFGWITVNYLLGYIDPDRPEYGNTTVGALDLGGASTQITFIPADDTSPANTSDYYYPLQLYGDQHRPYTYSFLCWGLNEARHRYVAELIAPFYNQTHFDDPCGFVGDVVNITAAEVFLPPCTSGPEAEEAWGTRLPVPDVQSMCNQDDCSDVSLENTVYVFSGTGDNARCRQLVDRLFPQRPCPFPSCSFNGVYQPSLVSASFLAFSGFFYQAEPANLTGLVTMASFLNASDVVCNMTYSEVIQLPKLNLEFASRYCFTLKYAATLLADGYNFPIEASVDMRSDINGTSTAWALGYVINATNVIPVDYGPSLFLHDSAFVAMVTLLAMLMFIVLLLSIAQCVRWRKSDDYLPLHQNEATSYGST